LVGAISYLGGYAWGDEPGALAAAGVILAFFVPSVALSRLGRARKRELVDIAKQGARNAMQVGANGGVATVCAMLAATSSPAQWAMWGFAGAFAAATADTWATEIGSAFGGTPRSIAGWQPIPPGLSGGITTLGSIAALCGAVWIGACWSYAMHNWNALWIVGGAGVFGALTDSIFGATLQELRRCPACERDAETNPHVCGTPTVRVRGVGWMSNDAVNLAATAAGALFAAIVGTLVR
jgi:uncharacterized protein (TIGR00297 family)